MDTSAAARALGRRGGRARAARLSVDQRKAIAALGGKARSLSFHASRRIAENFRYVEAVDALRPHPVTVTRIRSFSGTLPGAIAEPLADGRRPSRRRR
jgi:hypothetical protein